MSQSKHDSFVQRTDREALLRIRDNKPAVWERLGKTFNVPTPAGVSYERASYEQFAAIIDDLCNRSKRGYTVVGYHHLGKYKTGRRFSDGMSYQGLHRQIRHAIAADLYYDLDIKNAHPTFAQDLARKLGVAHPLLDEYVTRRDPFLARCVGATVPSSTGPKPLTTPGDVKTYLLRVLNGGGRGDTSHPELNAFHAATEVLLTRVYKAAPYRNFKNQADKSDKAKGPEEFHNPKGTCISLVLCNIEDKALQVMEQCARRAGAVVGALCFDGLMIEKASITPEGLEALVAEMSRSIELDFGYPVTVINKPMNEAVDLTGLDRAPEAEAEAELQVEADPVDDVELATTDEALALRMLGALEVRGLLHDAATPALYIYDPETALWRIRDYKYLGTLVAPILTPWALASLPDRTARKLQVSLKSVALQGRIVSSLTQFVRARSDSIDRLDRSPGVFPIADNKVIDLRTGVVRDRERDDYFTKSTPRRIVNLSAAERAELLDYFEDVLSAPELPKAPVVEGPSEIALAVTGAAPEDIELAELLGGSPEGAGPKALQEPAQPAPKGGRASQVHRDALISFCAYVLSGENNLKLFANLIGERDAGKSLFLELLGAVCGDFHCTANARLFVEQRNQACHDSELFNLRGRRMAYLSETSGANRFNEDLIKRISGGDRVNIRAAGEKQTVDELFSCVLMLATNNVCQFTDAAFMSRLACFNFSNSFARDASVKDRMLSKVDQFFTLIVEYAGRYYAAGRKITLSPEVLAYTATVIEEQDTTAVWCREQANFSKAPADQPDHPDDSYVVKADIFEQYQSHWKFSGRRYDGKIKFFRRFEEIYKLPPATKMRIGHEVKAVYRGIKQLE